MPDKEKINIKLLAAILVALMSAYSTYMSTHASSKSDVNQEKSDTKFEALMSQMNTLIIPQIQKELQEIKYSLREQAQDESSTRERIARLEAIVEHLPRRYRTEPNKTFLEKARELHLKEYKKIKTKEDVKIPIIQQSMIDEQLEKEPQDD